MLQLCVQVAHGPEPLPWQESPQHRPSAVPSAELRRYAQRALTRLEVKGFKNLCDVAVEFGPFTCSAGPNGAGKSNVFDAIQLLAELADRPLMQAARIRAGGEERTFG